MLTDFQKQKMRKLFDFWDHNNSGQLEKVDYQDIAQRVATERGWDRNSPDYASTYNAVMTNWAQLEHYADANDDDVITIEEWMAYCTSLVNDVSAFRVNAMELMTALLNAVDRDSDGLITLADYQLWFRIYNADASQAEAAFQRMDTDGNGSLSIDEIISALHDFYFSNAPSAPGNFLFGELDDA
jgi:Ca2+-binding EF-hand superfamily protein